MYDFQNELQALNLGDFQASQPVPYDPNQLYDDQDRIFLGVGGFGRCSSCFSSCFNCFNCFNCFSCFNCFHCGGHRCGGHHCGGGHRCGGR
ncbi:heterocycloanthracin/sonorensin family bacteriocin [Niallia endozanthoxylica]|uniref:Heterocycloanthracin/sonorensin family bacteriocin n=1 Tax=Niallia endozanthoxylica TaxID=2036016 RepID=A0A5J5I0E0_9BACI|nr:heterocycloanthracin/sonorensin family bacteriocin [Niallia endozanthoxylica]KAA9029105.1 heterocycloanthracin/sonorensin family bacteriocin [Niallia endozanthoxylica]